MRVLLDTHAFLWYVLEDRRLSDAFKRWVRVRTRPTNYELCTMCRKEKINLCRSNLA